MFEQWLQPASGGLGPTFDDGYGGSVSEAYRSHVTHANGTWAVIDFYNEYGLFDGAVRVRTTTDPSGDWISVDPLASTSNPWPEVITSVTPLVYGGGTWAFVVSIRAFIAGEYSGRDYICYSDTPEVESSWNTYALQAWSPAYTFTEQYFLAYSDQENRWAIAKVEQVPDGLGAYGRFDVSFAETTGNVVGPYFTYENVYTDTPDYYVGINYEYPQHNLIWDGDNWVAIVGLIPIGGIGSSPEMHPYRRTGSGWVAIDINDQRLVSKNFTRNTNGFFPLEIIYDYPTSGIAYLSPGNDLQTFSINSDITWYTDNLFAYGSGYWISTEYNGNFSYAEGGLTPDNLTWTIVYDPVDLGYTGYADWVRYVDIWYADGYFVMLTDLNAEIRYYALNAVVPYYPLRMSQRNDIYGVVQSSTRMNNSTGSRSSSSYTSNRVFGNGNSSYI